MRFGRLSEVSEPRLFLRLSDRLSGLSDVVSVCDGPGSVSTMTKSSVDWDAWKEENNMGDELEQACCDPRISRSWLANLEIFPLIWTARRTLIEQRSRCVSWITALKEDRYKDLSDDAFLFSREEIRTLIMQRLLTQGCGATTMRG